MTLTDLALHIAAIAAAFFQAVTGIGFGMIAGPVILVVLADTGAVLISTAMSWLIALVLAPGLWRGADWTMWRRLMAGAVLGLGPGLAVLAAADLAALRLLAGAVIAGLTAMLVFGAPGMDRPGRAGDLAFGALAGLFGGCLAMPGPTAAVRMAGLGYDKATIRATMVTFFAAVWALILAGQLLVAGARVETLANAAMLTPATLAGLALGNWAAARLSERLFRRLVIAILVATAASLLASSALHYLEILT